MIYLLDVMSLEQYKSVEALIVQQGARLRLLPLCRDRRIALDPETKAPIWIGNGSLISPLNRQELDIVKATINQSALLPQEDRKKLFERTFSPPYCYASTY